MNISAMGKIGLAVGGIAIGAAGIYALSRASDHKDAKTSSPVSGGDDAQTPGVDAPVPPTAGTDAGSVESGQIVPNVDVGSTSGGSFSLPGSLNVLPPGVSSGDELYPGDIGGVSPGDEYPTFPGYPGGDSYSYVASAVRAAAPWDWTSANIATVTNAALSSGARASDAANMVRQVYSSTPYSFSSTDEARLAAAGLTSRTNAYDVANIIDNVEYATPYSWSTRSDVRLSLAAINGHVPSSAIAGVIDGAIAQAGWYGGESAAVSIAESRMLQGNYGSYPYPDPGYPSVPSRPTFPNYPTFPSYPDPGYPDPGYPGGVSDGDDYPSIPGGRYPGGVSGGDDYPSVPRGSYPGGVSGGDDYPG